MYCLEQGSERSSWLSDLCPFFFVPLRIDMI
jgi:hypothetical protein